MSRVVGGEREVPAGGGLSYDEIRPVKSAGLYRYVGPAWGAQVWLVRRAERGRQGTSGWKELMRHVWRAGQK